MYVLAGYMRKSSDARLLTAATKKKTADAHIAKQQTLLAEDVKDREAERARKQALEIAERQARIEIAKEELALRREQQRMQTLQQEMLSQLLANTKK